MTQIIKILLFATLILNVAAWWSLDSIKSKYAEYSKSYGKSWTNTLSDYATSARKSYEESKIPSNLYETSKSYGKSWMDSISNYARGAKKSNEESKIPSNLYETSKNYGKSWMDSFSGYATEAQKAYQESKIPSELYETSKNLGEKVGNALFGIANNHKTTWCELLTGSTVGATHNAANYLIKIGGRSSNILNIYDLNSISSRGNPTSYSRIDMPHGNVPYHHINVNPRVTGVPDPHTRIWGVTAHAAGITGRALSVVNKVAPVAMAASIACDVKDIWKVYNSGKKQDAMKKGVKKVSTYVVASYGASMGAAIGSFIFPGVGTLLGGLCGGVVGGIGGGIGADALIDMFNL